jgi:osmotically-inducible protein OsmY
VTGFKLRRLGILTEPQPGNPLEVEGVLMRLIGTGRAEGIGTSPTNLGAELQCGMHRAWTAFHIQRTARKCAARLSLKSFIEGIFSMTKTDLQLKHDIELELLWDPKVNAAQIGVTVDKGAVSLLGAVDTYPEKWAAEDATKRVSGVRSFAQDLTVKILGEHARNDGEIAAAVQNALQWNVYLPPTVTAKVQSGTVTLEGHVTANYQREAAEHAVRYLAGVVNVYNAITLTQTASPTQVKEKVQAALQRQAKADADSIVIDASDGKVTLTGHASSWQSIKDAAHAAWAAPGVTQVVEDVRIAMSPA